MMARSKNQSSTETICQVEASPWVRWRIVQVNRDQTFHRPSLIVLHLQKRLPRGVILLEAKGIRLAHLRQSGHPHVVLQVR